MNCSLKKESMCKGQSYEIVDLTSSGKFDRHAYEAVEEGAQ
jgi:hypothetical protein